MFNICNNMYWKGQKKKQKQTTFARVVFYYAYMLRYLR
jgi:hypothetical protein